MNTIGKILVVLNFLFAVIVGVLLVFDFATRNQWKLAYEKLEREAKVVATADTATKNANKSIADDFKTAQQKYVELLKQKEDLEILKQIAEDKYNADRDEFAKKLKDKDVTLLAASEANKRLTNEIADLNKTIGEREKAIVALQASYRQLQINALTYEGLAKARQEQNETLLEQIRGLTVKIARLEGGVNPDADVIRNPNAPNPPAVLVNGKIEKVDADLVQISLGTDHGVNKNNTLDVYRRQPEAKYIGMIRIVDAHPHNSVGRIVPLGAQARPQVRQGDLVTSKLSR